MTSCIFCDILFGIAPASFIQRDDLCAAFMDIRPVNPGHVLVVPHAHAALVSELDAVSIGHMLQVAQRVDVALRASGIKCEGVNLIISDGAVAGQEVPHVHLHVIPRFRGDGHHFRFSPAYFTKTPASELGKNAELIRMHMEGQS
jgi:histidine triad (HIT) family protein